MSASSLRVLAAAVLVAGCSSSDAQPKVPVPDGIPQGPVANVAWVNTGGRLSATLTGGKSGNAEMHDVSFCATHVTAGTMKMEIFALAANNESWAVNISGSNGLPSVGDHVIDSTDYKSIGAGLTDKTTGKTTVEWQQYKAKSGTITITRADSARVVGSYRFSAAPTSPASTGAAVAADGTFDAPLASTCQRRQVMK